MTHKNTTFPKPKAGVFVIFSTLSAGSHIGCAAAAIGAEADIALTERGGI